MEKDERALKIAKRLVELRGERTRSGVARKLGIGYNSLTNYENGTRIPPDDVKMKISAYYGRSVQEIFYD